jgi:hypothetical protein
MDSLRDGHRLMLLIFTGSSAREHWSDIMSGRKLVTHELHTPTVVPGPVPPKYAASIQPISRTFGSSRPFEHGSKKLHDP